MTPRKIKTPDFDFIAELDDDKLNEMASNAVRDALSNNNVTPTTPFMNFFINNIETKRIHDDIVGTIVEINYSNNLQMSNGSMRIYLGQYGEVIPLPSGAVYTNGLAHPELQKCWQREVLKATKVQNLKDSYGEPYTYHLIKRQTNTIKSIHEDTISHTKAEYKKALADQNSEIAEYVDFVNRTLQECDHLPNE